MSVKSSSRTVKLLAGASVLGLALAATPFAVSIDWHNAGATLLSAQAKDGADDNAGDDRGGRGGGERGRDHAEDGEHGEHGEAGDDHGGSGRDHAEDGDHGEHGGDDDVVIEPVNDDPQPHN